MPIINLYITGRNFCSEKEERVRTRRATDIQRTYRGVLGRRRGRRWRVEMVETRKRRVVASCAIQQAFRIHRWNILRYLSCVWGKPPPPSPSSPLSSMHFPSFAEGFDSSLSKCTCVKENEPLRPLLPVLVGSDAPARARKRPASQTNVTPLQ